MESCAPTGSNRCSSKRAQDLRLRLQTHIPDFIEEQRPAVGLLELAVLSSLAPVKLPLRWPNSSLSISSSGIAAQFTSMNGSFDARAVLMNRVRDQFFAGAAFSEDQDPAVGPRHQRQAAAGALSSERCRR